MKSFIYLSLILMGLQVHCYHFPYQLNAYRNESALEHQASPSEKNAEKQINDYVKTKTHGRISDAVRGLSERTKMVSMNYIFFQGNWTRPFNTKLTKEANFTLNGNATVIVDMMHKRSKYKFLYDKSLSCSVVEIPSLGGIVTWFILPDEGKLRYVERTWTEEHLFTWAKSFKTKHLMLSLPKFSISATHDVKDALQKLGMINVFSEDADLSGITGKRNLWLSEVLQKSVVVVQEKNVVSAQSVIQVKTPQSTYIDKYRPINFNRPFLLVTYDPSTESILFMGKIQNPANQTSEPVVITKLSFFP